MDVGSPFWTNPGTGEYGGESLPAKSKPYVKLKLRWDATLLPLMHCWSSKLCQFFFKQNKFNKHIFIYIPNHYSIASRLMKDGRQQCLWRICQEKNTPNNCDQQGFLHPTAVLLIEKKLMVPTFNFKFEHNTCRLSCCFKKWFEFSHLVLQKRFYWKFYGDLKPISKDIIIKMCGVF